MFMELRSLVRYALPCILLMWMAAARADIAEADQAETPVAQPETQEEAQPETHGEAQPQAQEEARSETQEDPALTAARDEQRARAQALAAQIEELGYNLGSYDPALIELQDDLGRTYLALEQYELAHTVLEQAMQLVRVNDGLYSERQIELLQQLVQANVGRRDWEQADVYAHLAFDLQGRVYTEDSAEYASALMALSDWRLQAARHNLLVRAGAAHTVQMLHDLQDQHDAALVHARERVDVEQQWSLLYAKARTEAEVARQYNYQQLTDFTSPSPRFVTQTICRTVPDGNGSFQRVCWRETVSNPEYLYAASTQRRSQNDRARMRLQATVREMEALLEDNPEFAAAHEHATGDGLKNIQNMVSDLQREARRSALRQW